MKKIILTVGVLFGMFLILESCKQEHLCSCDKTYITGAGTSVENYTLYPYTDSKRRAETRCKANNTSNMDSEGAYDINCQVR